MLRFVAFAVLVVNCILSPVLSASGEETKVDPFDLYNDLYEECLRLPAEERLRRSNKVYFTIYENVKDRRVSSCDRIKNFQNELEMELDCFNWILNHSQENLIIARALVYLFYLSINYHDHAKAQFYLYRFREKFHLEVSSEQKKNAEDFQLIAALLTLFSDNDLYEQILLRWVTVEQVYANQTNSSGKDYFWFAGKTLTCSEIIIRTFFPDAPFPRPMVSFPSDSENTKLLSKLHNSEISLLDSKSEVKGSRIIGILKDLLLSEFEEDYREWISKSETFHSISKPEINVNETVARLAELELSEQME